LVTITSSRIFSKREIDEENTMAKKAALCAAVTLGLMGMAHASEQEGWQFELTPYIWGANVDGDLTVGQQKADIDNDLWENLDNGFMGMAVISYNRLVLYMDLDYLELSDDAETKNGVLVPSGTKIKSNTDVTIATAGLGWRFDTWGEDGTLDVLLGVRNTNLDLELEGGGEKLSRDTDVTDPLLMLRPSWQISERWRFNPTLSVGLGGDSDTTYELMPQFQFKATDYFALRFGYKRLYYDVNSGHKYNTDYRSFEGSFSGPFIGFGWTFPVREKPAPVVAQKEPLPMPAVKCSDTDNDGVCDNTDQCPSTPPGKRVGPAGCDCDYTLTTNFAFDSAELTDADKDELDKLAKVLVNPKLNFVTGHVDGYTDTTGKPEYNQKLSERRAQAVADYLQSKGVAVGSRMGVQGHGEADPIADNNTEEGRGLNRRVVIRRTDCSAR
jgi:outer membrane protein OmpA-like peptidoglycan-associated protein